MNFLTFLKNNYESLTSSEQVIADYVLKIDKEILSMSSREIANKTGTSPATVVRFSNKLGFKNFNEFKLKFTIDCNEKQSKPFEFINQGLTTEGIVGGIKEAYSNSLNKTISLVDVKKLDKAIELLKNANNIYIYGLGSSALVAMDLYYKLIRINKRVICHNDSHLQMTFSAVMEKGDVALAISYSGETKEVLKSVKNGKKLGVPIIAITRKAIDNTLASIADITLYIPAIEKDLREGAMSSRISQLTIVDMLYIGMVKDDITATEEKLIRTRKVIEEFKNE
ncbi:MurR/RpiR family transcriptional regulator [Clostridium uliginosum]|uniref:DNA-binding transcriptional regulator, MurR/RpiR family, contains HTH and SIS domains n=1 Tax=Clostridium uliginosum TaxID=119641 RepID=A0A1I1MZF8_9CLOT|nr:MurR/RpiR family transcriptional regulator [Clostridium uliginosum]SFC90791.1 DNA-binding transcriptional regulator, MurR/RpiR family, contains HTH and SIS domains [Clostridium uliginosum]